MIDVELPIDGLLALIEFLEPTGVSTKVSGDGTKPHGVEYRSQIERGLDSIRRVLTSTYKLSEICQSDLIRAESSSGVA